MDLSALGGSIAAITVGLGTVFTGGFAWWMRNKRVAAETRADVAESNSQAVTADAQSTVYKLMLERVTTLEADMRNVRQELTAERAHSRRQDNYIWQLIRLLRERGIEPPPFEGGEGGA